jgi:hypothetical protein
MVTTGILPKPSIFTRLFNGGVAASPFELWLLEEFVRHLPPELAVPCRAQLAAVTLVQRDPEWLETRFYRKVAGHVDWTGVPPLPIDSDDAKLLGLTITPSPKDKSIHAVLRSVQRHVFMMTFDTSIRAYAGLGSATVQDVRHSWRGHLASGSA